MYFTELIIVKYVNKNNGIYFFSFQIVGTKFDTLLNMPKLSKISFIMLLFLSVSAISLAASNIYVAFNDSGNEVVVYPNPVLGSEFSIKADQDISEITILNVLGQPVYSRRYLSQKKVSIELEISERGVFIVQVKTSDGKTITKRILFK